MTCFPLMWMAFSYREAIVVRENRVAAVTKLQVTALPTDHCPPDCRGRPAN